VPLEIRTVCPELEQQLAEFFSALRLSDEGHFHPHPFTFEYASELARYCGQDMYYLCLDCQKVLCYGMLRGWDEGFEIPSLGIAVHPDARRAKVGESMMHFLHSAARWRGAKRVRLKVYEANIAARSLYEKMGYRFESIEDGQLVGLINL